MCILGDVEGWWGTLVVGNRSIINLQEVEVSNIISFLLYDDDQYRPNIL